MKKNTFFEELKKAGEAWDAARQERMARKEQIIAEFGWDSDELKAWHKENDGIKFPFAQGAVKAYRAYYQSKENEQDELEMSDFLWDNEVHDFVETLRQAGIESFIYTNESTACMENLHAFAAEGCTLAGLATTKQKSRWLSDEPKEIKGIRFTL